MIGIIAAMDAEIHEFIKRMDRIEKTVCVADCEMTYGSWKQKEVVLCKSGVGKSAAAMSCAILCMQEPLEAIVNVGTAGGLIDSENVLDIVISDEVVQADYDTSALDGDAGIGLVYPSDEVLRTSCIEVAQALNIPYHVGCISSQDLFMSRPEDFDALMKRFPKSICSEMEAGAIGQVASKFHVPFVIVRCLSDVVCHEDNHMEFSTYVEKASAQSALLIENWLQKVA